MEDHFIFKQGEMLGYGMVFMFFYAFYDFCVVILLGSIFYVM